MSRLAQLGVFSSVMGSVAMFMGLFPGAMTVDSTPGMGLGQIFIALLGLTLITGGAYIFVYATWHRGGRRTLYQDIGIRMGLTGLTFAVAVSLADVFGFGSHSLGTGITFGRIQSIGMAIGFLIASLGVFIYGIRR
jgi:hypothetical protein